MSKPEVIEGIDWQRKRLSPPGYSQRVHKTHTLKWRVEAALYSNPGELKYLLWKYGVSYRIESAFDILRYVAFLDKPLAEILDEMRIPREWEGWEFTEFCGPSIEFVGPPEKSPYMLRRVMPGLIKIDDVGVQPMSEPLLLPLLMHTDPLPDVRRIEGTVPPHIASKE
jgi:hypothetical protein